MKNCMIKLIVAVIMLTLISVNAMAVKTIHKYVQSGEVFLVLYSISLGDDINSMDQRYGHTPLTFAASTGNEAVAKVLLDHGADINRINVFKKTPLHVAVANGHHEFVKLLIEKSANINATTISLVTPLHIAAEKGDLEIVKLLIKNGAEIGAKDRKGKTVIEYASAENHHAVVELVQNYRNK